MNKKRYHAFKVSNVDEFLTHGIGYIGEWELHSVVPSITAPCEKIPTNTIVIQWLVVLRKVINE